MLKSIAGTFLLFIFCFNLFGGDYILFKIEQHKVRKEIVGKIKAGIADENLTAISINSTNEHLLNWKDKEEFSFNGEMFDVVNTESFSNGNKIYHCLTDNQESKLIKEFQKNSEKKRKNKNNRNSADKVVKYFEPINPLPQKDSGLYSIENKISFFKYSENYASLALEISSPPPKTS